MSKQIKIGIKNSDKMEFEILEPGNKGDYFFLEDIEAINFHNLWTEIEDHKNKYINKIWEKEKNNIFIESEEFKSKDEKIKKLTLEKNKLEAEKELIFKEAVFKSKEDSNNEISQLKAEKKLITKNRLEEIETAVIKAIQDKEQLIQNLTFEKNKLEAEKELVLKEAIFKSKEESNDKISQLKAEKKLITENKSEEIKNAISKAVVEKDKEIMYLISENQSLVRDRSALGTKMLGDDLENYIFDLFQEYMGSYEDVKFYRTNKNIKGNKPDFQFEVYSSREKNEEEKLISVTIEAKTEYNDTEKINRKSNSFYFSKLETDRENNNGDYSLLITELEREKEFTIRSIGEYQNMFMCRPANFISFLIMVYKIALKQKDVLKKSIDFKNRLDILAEFNEFKDNILNNSIASSGKKIEYIVIESNKIINSANKQKDFADILETNISTIKNKLEKFQIEKKILNKISDVTNNI